MTTIWLGTEPIVGRMVYTDLLFDKSSAWICTVAYASDTGSQAVTWVSSHGNGEEGQCY